MRKNAPDDRSGPSQRQLRAGELIRHALSGMLTRGDIHDDVIASHVITVSEVRMSPDLKLATVFIMPLGGEDVGPVLESLERNKRFIRGAMARAVNLKFAPDIRFRKDESFESGHHIDRLLDSLKEREDQERERD
ncbi:MAG: 30S ribosome-binding factor RbfA [Hyphomicrobiaceae bacterium]|nr:30S ribosome-binding factor RbfA [Hyphomicrobiaceae bacterium]